MNTTETAYTGITQLLQLASLKKKTKDSLRYSMCSVAEHCHKVQKKKSSENACYIHCSHFEVIMQMKILTLFCQFCHYEQRFWRLKKKIEKKDIFLYM